MMPFKGPFLETLPQHKTEAGQTARARLGICQNFQEESRLQAWMVEDSPWLLRHPLCSVLPRGQRHLQAGFLECETSLRLAPTSQRDARSHRAALGLL